MNLFDEFFDPLSFFVFEPHHSQQPYVDLDIQSAPIELSLADIYYGCRKQIEYTKHYFNGIGNSRAVVTRETIVLQPGTIPESAKVVVRSAGHYTPRETGDLKINLVEKKESKNINLERDGRNLIYTKKIQLSESLSGCSFNLRVFDKTLFVNLSDKVITPDTKVIFENEGIPLDVDRGIAGDFIVKFEIEFPPVKFDEGKLKIIENILKGDQEEITKVLWGSSSSVNKRQAATSANKSQKRKNDKASIDIPSDGISGNVDVNGIGNKEESGSTMAVRIAQSGITKWASSFIRNRYLQMLSILHWVLKLF